MKAKIHYEEDLFFLTLQMKWLREGLKLQIDADYFQDKVLADIRFVDATLDKILSTLKENPNLIRRAEYLYNLVKVEATFVEMMNEVLSGTGDVTEALSQYRSEFIQRRDSHDSDIHEIRTLLRIVSQEDDRDDVITSDELTLLTRQDDEQDQ